MATECSMTLSKNGEEVSFYPQGDPVELAARIQDFIAAYRKMRQAHPEGLQVGGKANFAMCHEGCSGHYKLGFHADGTFEIGWDNQRFAAEALALLEKIVDEHELLVHACELCQL